MDRVKILYQVNPDRAFTMRRAVKTFMKISRNTGVEGLACPDFSPCRCCRAFGRL